jgi:hypothetical protein
MSSLLKKGWLWWLLAMTSVLWSSLAFAGGTIHASGYVGTFILIIVIAILACVALWAIGYWGAELNSISPLLVKILKFIIIAIALIWILLIIAGLFGVHIT